MQIHTDASRAKCLFITHLINVESQSIEKNGPGPSSRNTCKHTESNKDTYTKVQRFLLNKSTRLMMGALKQLCKQAEFAVGGILQIGPLAFSVWSLDLRVS